MGFAVWGSSFPKKEEALHKRLYLIDGSGFIYRAYYGIQDLAMVNGVRTNAIFGFANMLLKIIREESPDCLAVVFDRPREESFRLQIYSEYKATRDAMPVDLVPQIPYIKRLVEALNVPALEAPTFEADDVIATLARRYAAEGLDVTVVTGDKDLMQIVDKNVSLLDTMKNRRSGIPEVKERFGVAPGLVPDILGLAGDTSDNIPGVPGIGEKIAAELVQRFGPLEKVLEWKDLVSGKKRRENLGAFANQARLSKDLATVRYDVPLDTSLEDMNLMPPDLSALMPLLEELEFKSLIQAFNPAPAGVVEIYTDGSGLPSGLGGYGVVLRYGNTEKELNGVEQDTTSQRMELTAAIRGLETLTRPSRVRLVSDSQYLVRGMNEWLEKWVHNGRLDDGGDLANKDLWRRLAALDIKHEIQWEWVRGHSGHLFNERCDLLAQQAVRQASKGLESKPEKEVTEQPPSSPSVPPVVPLEEETDTPGYDFEETGQLRFY